MNLIRPNTELYPLKDQFQLWSDVHYRDPYIHSYFMKEGVNIIRQHWPTDLKGLTSNMLRVLFFVHLTGRNECS